MTANYCQILCFAGSLCRTKYSFLKQQYEKKMPEPLQSYPSGCGFYTLSAAFHFFKFRQEEPTGIQDVNVPSLLKKYM